MSGLIEQEMDKLICLKKGRVMISSNSLAKTLDAIGEAFFYDHSLSAQQKQEAADWIIRRQYKSGKQAGVFAPTGYDYQEGTRLFTGEKLKTKLATRNILTEEAARVLVCLGVTDIRVQGALGHADRWLLQQCFSGSCTIGECAHSAVGLMRYLSVRRSADSERRLAEQIEVLSRHRDGKGRWRRFPFFYTLLALSEIDLRLAVEEMRYAAPACERVLRRSAKEDGFFQRRRAIVQRALARC